MCIHPIENAMNRKYTFKAILILSFLSTALLSMSQDLSGDWKGKLALGVGRELPLVLHISTAVNSVTMDSPAQGAFGMTCTVKYLGEDSLNITIPKLMVNYAAKCQNNNLVGQFKQGGVQLPLNLERGETAKPKRPQNPPSSVSYSTEEVSIVSDIAGVTLSGTLTLPANVNKSTPMVVMVTGSGQQNRDEEIFDHKPFAVIAHFLAENGIASLRYDDRGFGKSTGDVSSATTADFAHDTQTAIDWLRKNKQFAKVGVLGHSEGGMIAYMLCRNNDNSPDFIVSIAGPTVSGEKILEYQNVDARAKYGINESQAKSIFQSKKSELSKNPWMAFFIQYDPKDDLCALRQPALLIFGGKDKQVPPSINLEPARNYAPKAEIVCYPELNHLMQHAVTGDVSEYAQIEESIAPEVLQKLVEFIGKQPR